MEAASGSVPDFGDLLVSMPPRERSGSRSSNRFAFQHSWALGLTLKLHETPSDYCLLYDVHDDVVTLDHSSNPTKADFYQIKTKSTGNWTMHQLTSRELGKRGPLPSIIGKLYDHYLRFNSRVGRMTIVSNAHFDIKLKSQPGSKERDSICATELDVSELADLSSKLVSEHNLASTPDAVDLTYLETTSLSLIDHETHTEGIVSDFLSRHGDGCIPPRPFHKTLHSEIQRRNNKECSPSSFTELLIAKGITRATLQAMIDSIPSAKQQDDLMLLIREQLAKEGVTFRQLSGFVSDLRTFFAKRYDQTNYMLMDAVRKAQSAIAALPQSVFDSSRPLNDAIAQLSLQTWPEWRTIREQYSESFLHALFIVVLYEQGISSIGPQPQEENS